MNNLWMPNPNGDEGVGKCPNCYQYGVFEIDLNESKKQNKFIMWCKCGWYGDISEFVNDDEEKNIKRTKLIDNILNESVM